MTNLTNNGNSISDKDIDSPLSVGDLLAVFNTLFGQDFTDRLMSAATKSKAGNDTETAATVGSKKAATNATVTGDAASVVLTDSVTSAAAAITPTSVQSDVIASSAASRVESSESGSRWYAVTVGKDVGVFTGWTHVAPLVVRVSGACYPRFSSRQAAEEAFQRALADGNVRRVV